jgi:hypothetical protein
MSDSKGLILFISITVIHCVNVQLKKLTEVFSQFS